MGIDRQGKRDVSQWKYVFSNKVDYFNFGFLEIWRRKYLLYLLIRKQFVLKYKQTVLGPAWAVLQPFAISVVFLIVFNKSLGISTGTTPPILFYVVGSTCWAIFSSGFMRVAGFLFQESQVLLRVWISKPLMAVSAVLSDLLMSILPLLLIFSMIGYYTYQGRITPNWHIVLIPFLLFGIMVFALAMGYIAARISIKYRDIFNIYSFLVQAFMYISAVIYPLSSIKSAFSQNLLLLNPMVGYLEAFRYACFGEGFFSWGWLLYNFSFTLLLFFIGNVMLRQTDKIYADVL